jgi:chromosome segregation ATPase
LIESQGGEMSPSTADFSQITELQQFKKLYEEQEEKQKLQLSEKDEEIGHLHGVISSRDEQIEEVKARLAELAQDRDKLRGDYARLRKEAQEKIDKLMERIKELNQRIMGGDAGQGKTGAFR